MRIVSLLPSTTEILFAVGAGDDVVGVTFECDTPDEARSRTIVSTSAMPEGLTARQVDDFVSRARAAGEDLYRLHEDALRSLDADLVVTQDLCAVCAVDVTVVDDALNYLGCTADVLTIDPRTLDEVLLSVATLGERTGHADRARQVIANLRDRLEVVRRTVSTQPSPRVLVLEWTDPPFAPGHWVPEMIERAGGVPVLGVAGADSFRTAWEDVARSEPDLVVCAPCGHDAEGSAELGRGVLSRLPAVPVWAVDANASFARPGPRLVDGIETLARILHPSAGARTGAGRTAGASVRLR